LSAARTCIPYSPPRLEVEAGKNLAALAWITDLVAQVATRNWQTKRFSPVRYSVWDRRKSLFTRRGGSKRQLRRRAALCRVKKGGRCGGLHSVVKIKRIKLQLGIPLNLCDLHLDLSLDWRGWFVSCSIHGGRQHFLVVSVHRKRLGLAIC
jgi:hypothetical protein